MANDRRILQLPLGSLNSVGRQRVLTDRIDSGLLLLPFGNKRVLKVKLTHPTRPLSKRSETSNRPLDEIMCPRPLLVFFVRCVVQNPDLRLKLLAFSFLIALARCVAVRFGAMFVSDVMDSHIHQEPLTLLKLKSATPL
jgi:hypothetical protein